MSKRNKFSGCYGIFMLLAAKKMKVQDKHSSNMKLAVMIIKEKCKKEFGIKSLSELGGKNLKKFQAFLENKLYEKS